MVQSLEAIKGGGGSIRVGTTGTVISLMTRELDSMKISSHHQSHNQSSSSSSSSSSRRKSLDIESSSSSNNIINTSFTTQQVFGVKKPNKSNKSITTTQKIQLLGPQGNNNNTMSFDSTPIREKRGPTFVEIVDIKCGTSSEANRAWTAPITSRLKKLGFSKLSDHNNNNNNNIG